MLTRTTATILPVILAIPITAQAQQPQLGLIVRLYDIGRGMHLIPELAPNQLPNVVNVIPTLELRSDRGDFKPFEGNFYTEVTGYLKTAQPGTYTFRLISDDGSCLWIDDQLVINHDGLHGAVPKDGDIDLTAGQHKLRVAHFESAGDEHLELQWRPPGAPDASFELIPPAALTHAADASRETSPGQKRIIPPLRRGLPGDGTPVAGMHPAFRNSPTLQRKRFEFSFLADGFLEMYRSLPGQPAPTVWVPDWTPADDSEAIAPLPAVTYTRQKSVRLHAESKRVFLDEENGCAFRLAAEPFDRLEPTKEVPFELLTVRAMTNGFEIEFTKPLDPRCGWEPESYYIEQWPFEISDEATERRSNEGSQSEPEAQARASRNTAREAVTHQSEPEAQARATQSEPEAQARVHPPTRDGIRYPVKSASISPDRKKVFLEIDDLKESHVVYIRLLPPCYSEDGERPWSTEAWYTLNVIPQDRYGKVLPPPEPEPQNFLTEEEKSAGWKLLFDGKTTDGWHGYRKDYMPDGWAVKDDCLARVGSGGDIATDKQFDNFELKLEWRICAAGNSGIFFRVSEEYDWPFFTGPEMQVLDNAEHADGRNPKTSAGSNYGLHAPLRDVTAPVGFFNQVRIVADGPHIEYWLNDVKIVEYELWTDEWKAMVADSKFKAWPNYGLTKKGHIVLQDHGDRVWYRNIKIRSLNSE